MGIDLDDVTSWFADHVGGARPPLRFSRVAGGHSCLTYIVTDVDGRRFVLRRPPMGHVLATAHDVAREHRVMAALQDSGVPVPAMIGLSAGDDVNGAPFYVMAHVEGVVLHDLDDATNLLPDDAARRRAGETLVDALVALHAVVAGRGRARRPVEGVGLRRPSAPAVVAAVGGRGDPGTARDAAAARLAGGPPARRRPAADRARRLPAGQRHPPARRVRRRGPRLGAVRARRSDVRRVVPAAQLGAADRR